MTDRSDKEQATADALGALPKTMVPPHDLWPGIQARLHARDEAVPPRRMPWRAAALAASVVVAFVVGLLLGRQDAGVDGGIVPDGTVPATAAVDASANPGMMAALRAAEREYQAAWKGFTPVGVAPTLLTAETRENIEASWGALRQAEVALLAALDEHPDNPYLVEKLLDLRAQQLGFVRQLYMLDQNSRRET